MPLFLLLFLTACTPGGDDTAGPSPVDHDGDGVDAGKDCDDENAAVHPRADEVCNGVDDNCDGAVDENPGELWYPDRDRDGYGDGTASGERGCSGAEGTVSNARDCDDEDPAVFPGAAERCNDSDDDCDGAADEGVPLLTWYADGDGDGAGDPGDSATNCGAISGYVDNALDCDDRDAGDPKWVDGPHGSNGNDGTIERPLKTVQKALAAGVACVYVQPGTYVEDIDFEGEATWVQSISGPTETVLQGTGDGPVVRFARGETGGLAGFTVTGGVGACQVYSVNWDDVHRYVVTECDGGGIYVASASPHLSDLVLIGNKVPLEVVDDGARTVTTGYGGGMVVFGGSPVLDGVEFLDNLASRGGGMYIGAGASVSGSRLGFLRGGGDWGAAFVVEGASASLTNVVVDGPISTSGFSGVYLGDEGNLELDHATVVDSTVGLTCAGTGRVTVTNAIFAYNDYGVWDTGGDCEWHGSYVDAFQNAAGDYLGVDWPGGTGFIALDPVFAEMSRDQDGTDDELRLAEGSGAIDAGTPSGEPDVDGSRADLGAYGGPEGSGW